MTENHIQIETLGLQHFCIKDKNPVDRLKLIYPNMTISDQQNVSKIDLEYIYQKSDAGSRFILLTDLNDWSYLIWNKWDFQATCDVAKELSGKLHTTVNYYFVDSQIATSRWIFADKGIITRAYFESHDEKLFDSGFSATENELRAVIKEVFVESLFWDLYNETCSSLEFVNRQNRKGLKLYTGQLDN